MQRMIIASLSAALVGAALVAPRPKPTESTTPSAAGPWRAIGAVHPRVSPDGEQIAFSYQGAIWRVPTASGVMLRISDGDGQDIEPAWSGDGKRIAFIRTRNFFTGELRVVDAADGSPVDLPAAAAALAKAVWSGKLHFDPAGRRVLGSVAPEPGKPEGLAWFDLESGELKLVGPAPRSLRRAALSHDGNRIAFATNQDVPGQQGGNDGPQSDLWHMPAPGGKPGLIVRWPARIHDVCWSGDGRSLIVTTDLGGAQYDLWQVPLENAPRNARKLTFGQTDEDRPSASRDGGVIVFTDNREGATTLIARNATSGDERAVGITKLDFGRDIGSVRIRVTVKSSGAPAVARIAIEPAASAGRGGKFFAPPGSLYRVERSNPHFYCDGATEFDLPAGDYIARVWHGPEFRAVRREFRIEAGKPTELAIELDRWEDASKYDLFSGENHIHANYGYGEWFNSPESMRLQCEGENLTVCNFMVANSDTDGIFDRQYFRGEPDPRSGPRAVLYWNQEFRSTIWGHMTLVNLRQLVEPIMTGFKDATNPHDVPTNSDIADRAHLQLRRAGDLDTNGLVNYTHVAQNAADPYLGAYTGKGMPVDVALGKIDSVDINNSYGGSVPLWYRLLNCGFRLPASAGTDCFLNRIRSRLPGSDRAYVRIDGDFSYTKWIEGLRAGRSFVTNGPLVELIVDGRHRPGAVIELGGPRDVKIVSKAWSQFPLDRVELIHDGRVIEPGRAIEGDAESLKSGRGATFERTLRIERSGWLAVRTAGPPHPDNPGGDNYAHSSPVYFEVAGQPADSRDDATYFLAWIDRLAAAVRERDRIPSDELKAHVESQIAAARRVYERLAAGEPPRD